MTATVEKRPTLDANWPFLAGANLFSVAANRTALILMATFIVISGPAGEQSGSASLTLLLPVVLLGFLSGAVCDRIGSRPSLVASSLLNGLLLLAVPAAMILTAVNQAALALIVALSCILFLLFSLRRFSIVPTLFAPRYLYAANAALWFCTAAGVLLAALVTWTDILPYQLPPPTVCLIVCAALSFVASILSWLTKVSHVQPGARAQRQAAPISGRHPIKEVFVYLRNHAGARDIVRLVVVLSCVFQLWNILLLYMVIENYTALSVDAHFLWFLLPPGSAIRLLFCFVFAGCALGRFFRTGCQSHNETERAPLRDTLGRMFFIIHLLYCRLFSRY